MNTKRSAARDCDSFLDSFDPSLRLLGRPTLLTGEIDRVAALALLASIAAVVPLAGGTAAAIVTLARTLR